MTRTLIQEAFAPIKRFLPRSVSNPIRSVATAFLTPVLFSYRTGHFLSSFKMAAVSRRGKPLPWFTYPSIDFLKYRSYAGRVILEFGGGQSTLWWAERARCVVTLEGDRRWYKRIKSRMPANVDLNHVSMESAAVNVAEVERVLNAKEHRRYDVIVIDGLYRYEMIPIASRLMAEDGIIVCDDAEGYGFYEGFKERGLSRVDFYGNAPGVVLPHCTSVFFKPGSFAFSSEHGIHTIAKED